MNTNISRTVDAIYLRPKKSIHGGHVLMNLSTGKLITCTKVKQVTITSLVIKAVKASATKQGFKSLKFFNRRKKEDLILDSDLITGVDESTQNNDKYPESDDSNYSDSDKEDDMPFEENNYYQEDKFNEEELQENLTDMMEDDQPQPTEVNIEDANEEKMENETEDVANELELDDDDKFEKDNEETVKTTTEHNPLVEQPSRTRSGKSFSQIARDGVEYSVMPKLISRKYNVRKRKHTMETRVQKVKFSKDMERSSHRSEMCHNLIHQEIGTSNKVQYNRETGLFMARTMHDMRELCMKFGVSFTQQYSLNRGIKKFGGRTKAEATSEVDQLYQRDCWKPIQIKNLTQSERKKAQECFILITQKYDGIVKGSLVFNGKPTRNYITKEDSASSTAANESTAITCAIDAYEGRDVATADVPNSFLQTDMPEPKPGEDRVIMKITGEQVDMMLELDLTLYPNYVVYKRKRKVIYVVILKALYVMLVASLFWYEKFIKDLQSIGFVFNPYNPCVANRMINGKQHTVRFRVDNIMSSHVDSKVINKFLQWLHRNYGKLKKVSATRGKIREYLGMTIDFLNKGKVKFKMIDFVEKMIEDFHVNFRQTRR